ncbi:MAG TPA: hypothetical protein VFE62_12295 [Gemmataceae bacterium]|nr:hypothetical protein [Pirellulales bacterium]HZZ79293.1 hypothetical protein [Gemmataceae bacterium]
MRIDMNERAQRKVESEAARQASITARKARRAWYNAGKAVGVTMDEDREPKQFPKAIFLLMVSLGVLEDTAESYGAFMLGFEDVGVGPRQ